MIDRPWMVLVPLLAACAAPPESPPPAEPAEPAPAPAVARTHWELDGLTVSALEGSPEYPEATIGLAGFDGGSAIAAGPVTFDFSVEGYELGVQTGDAEGKGIANSGQGQHIHLILDNGPYSAHYEASFDKELAEGGYVALAFLSRSYHESVKSPGAALVRSFSVGEAEAPDFDPEAPHLFYSRPKGTYQGADIERLMIDFFLLNADLAPDGYKVRATIQGQEVIFEKWVPYVVEGLTPGEVEIGLELLDAEGQPVPGPFNSVTRTVTLE